MVERKAAQMSQQTRGPYSATENKEKAAQGTGLSAAVVSKKKKKKKICLSKQRTNHLCVLSDYVSVGTTCLHSFM